MRYVLLLIIVITMYTGASCQAAPEEASVPVEVTPVEEEVAVEPPPDLPKYTMENVLAIARELSPECRIQVGTVIRRSEKDMC